MTEAALRGVAVAAVASVDADVLVVASYVAAAVASLDVAVAAETTEIVRSVTKMSTA